jgi:hypothetical protein
MTMGAAGVACYAVSVEVSGADPSSLMRLVAVMHGRHVEVLELELTRPVGGSRSFVAVFRATPSKGATVAASLRNVIEVTAVELREVADVELASLTAHAVSQ